MNSINRAAASFALMFALPCAAPQAVRAQQEVDTPADTVAPSTQPAGDESVEQRMRRQRLESFSGRPGPGPGPGEGRGDGFRGDGFRGDGFRGGYPSDMEIEPTPEEWEEVATFTQKYSPKRWNMFMQLPEEKRERVRRFMFWRYQQVSRLREEDPQMYDLHTRRLAIEDAIFPHFWTIRRADGEETKEVTEARQQLRQHVLELVDIGLKEREARLERMKRRYQEEEDRLSQDRGQREVLVEQRIDDILRRGGGPWMGGGDGPRRPFVGGPEGRAGEPIGGPRPPQSPTP